MKQIIHFFFVFYCTNKEKNIHHIQVSVTTFKLARKLAFKSHRSLLYHSDCALKLKANHANTVKCPDFEKISPKMIISLFFILLTPIVKNGAQYLR